MRLALAQGRQALPHCLPDPPVGCVIVQGNTVISSGFTQASRMALRAPLASVLERSAAEPE